jgi:hypothetical protein
LWSDIQRACKSFNERLIKYVETNKIKEEKQEPIRSIKE